MSGSRHLLRNFITSFAGNVIGQVLFFAGGLYLARMLGPSGYGIWSFAQAWQLHLLRIGEFGLEVTGMREIARRPENASEWITTVVISRLGIAVILYLVTLVVAVFDLMPLGTGGFVLLFSLSVFPMAMLLEWVYEGNQNIGTVSITRIVKGALFVLGVLVVVEDVSDLTNSVLIYVLSLTVPGLLISAHIGRSFGFDISYYSLRRGLGMMRSAADIGLAAILSHYSLFFGTMVVGYALSSTDLGLFSAAHRIVVLPWAHVFASLYRVLLPTLAILYHNSLPKYSWVVQRFFQHAVMGAIAIAIVGTFSGSALMSMLYSSAYEGAMGVFVILLWALTLAAMRFIFEIALVASDNQRRYLKGMFILAGVYTITTLIFTLNWGIEGAAWGSAVAELSYFTYLALTFPYLDGKALLKYIWKPLTGGILAVGVGLSLHSSHYSVQAVAGLSSYAAFLLISRAYTREDMRLFWSLLRKQFVET